MKNFNQQRLFNSQFLQYVHPYNSYPRYNQYSASVPMPQQQHFHRPPMPKQVGEPKALTSTGNTAGGDGETAERSVSLIFQKFPPGLNQEFLTAICANYGNVKRVILNGHFQSNFINYNSLRISPEELITYLNGIGLNDVKLTRKYMQQQTTPPAARPSSDACNDKSNNASSLEEGPCNSCQKKSDLKCNRCGDFYCSISCQTADWGRHRYICFQMPELVKGKIQGTKFDTEAPGVTVKSAKSKNNFPGSKKNWNNNNNKVQHAPNNTDKYDGASVSSAGQKKKFAPKNKFTNNKGEGKVDGTKNYTANVQPAKSDSKPSGVFNTNPSVVSNPEPSIVSDPKPSVVSTPSPIKSKSTENGLSDFVVYNLGDIAKLSINNEKPLTSSNNSTKGKEDLKNNETQSCAGSTISVGISLLVGAVQFPESRSTVTITGVVQSTIVSIRSVDRQADRNYNKIIETIDNLSSKSTLLTQLPSEKSFAACKYDTRDTVNYRVKIVAAKSIEEIKVFFIDLGMFAIKKLSDLKILPDSCHSFSKYVFLVELMIIPMHRNQDKALNYLKSFESDVSKQFKIVYEKMDDITKCELISKHTLESLNDKIAAILKEDNTESTNLSPVMTKPFKHIAFETSDMTKVMVLNNSTLDFGYFAACLWKHYDYFESLSQSIKEFGGNDSNPYRPIEGEYCLVYHERELGENQFSRATVTDCLPEDKFEMHFIDYVYSDIVEMKDIRRYPDGFIQSCVTSKCQLEGLPTKITREVSNRLKALISTDQLKNVRIVNVSDDQESATVEMKSVIDQLQSEFLF